MFAKKSASKKQSSSIEKVAVIGSGVMGSGIAAQIANAGIPVVLLDIKPKDGSNLAAKAIEKMLKADPAPFMSKRNAKLITPGNLEDDLKLLKDCDWIVEVVLEDLKVKHETYKKIEKHRKKGSIVSSNTSTIPLQHLVKGQGRDFEKDFLITHFFNPPRYMRLLELVVGEKTRADAVETIREFCDVKLGKGVVQCHDRPGFIANRLGVFWLTAGVNEAIKHGVSIEVADAVMSKPVGIPKTGVFGLIDLVGIDLMPHLSKSLLDTLPKDDAYRDLFIDHKFIHQMIEAGYTGRKGKGGFYRLNPDAPKGHKEKQALELDKDKFEEKQYAKADKPRLASVDAGKKGLRAVVTTEDEGGHYAWEVLKQTLHYAAMLVGEIADTVFDIDEAMRLGYNWKKGPFEMIDDLGPAWFAEELKKAGMDVPEILKELLERHPGESRDLGDKKQPDPGLHRDDVAARFYKVENGKLYFFGLDGQYKEVKRPEGVLLLHDIKLGSAPVLKNGSASVWDIGDGVLCFEHTSKMNTFEEGTFEMLGQVKQFIEKSEDYKALVIYNEGSHFSAGANLGIALFMINIAMWPQVEGFVADGQKMFKDLKYAPFPIVSAPSGLALGGGCEILLASDAVQAHAETYTGLVEVGVGVIPGWGGCKELLVRFQERERAKFKYDIAKIGKENIWFSPDTTPMGAVRKAFEVIGMATVAKSAQEAQEIGYFRESDRITMNRDRLLYDAKQRVLELAKDYQPPAPIEDLRLPGTSGKTALELAVNDLHKSGKATDYDKVVSNHLAYVLSGGDHDYTEPLHEDEILKLEVKEFMKLLHQEGTLARIEHMLDTGKPLRN